MKRIVSLVSVVLIFAVSFGFANGQQGTESQSSKVVFWTSHGPPDNGVLENIVKAYNATNPAVQVEFVQVPGSETDVTSLMTAVRGGTGPDVYMLDRFTVAQRASDGLLEDLTADLAKLDSNLKNKYLPFAWEEAQYRGKTYGLPFDTDTRGLFYRKDMLREVGIDPAELDKSSGKPITLARLEEIARLLDKKDAQG